MGHINARTVTIKKKEPSKPQKKIEFRRVTINNQVQRLKNDAASKRARR